MEQNKNVPAIRFKGFDDEWQLQPLNSFSTYRSSILSVSDALASGKYKIFDANETIGYTNYYNMKDDYITIIKDGSGVGRVRILKGESSFIATMGAISTSNSDLNFLYSILVKTDFRKHITGATIPHIYYSVYGKELYNIPKLSEQIQIGEFFKTIDEQITLLEQKHHKLLNLKSSMLKKMFPKEGDNVPEMRFKGFTEKWEDKKLGDVSLFLDYGLNASAKKFDGTNKYLRITDIDESSRSFIKNSLTSPDIHFENQNKYLLEYGDLLLARTGASVGKTYLYKQNEGKVYFAGFLIRARLKSSVNYQFIFQNTLTESYNRFIQITSQRSGQPGINAKEYSELSFKFPSFDEQQKIGAYFENLDHLIYQSQTKINKYKSIKQALLQKMFV